MEGSPLGGARARGASSSPPTAGREGYCLRPWVGRGKTSAGKAIVPPNYGGEGGLTSSICVIIACDNIHRISPHFVLWLVEEPRGICFSGCKHDRCHKVSKEPRGICYRFFRLLPTCKRGT